MNYVRNFRQLVALPDKDAKIPRTVNKSIRRLASIFLLISMLGFMPSLPAENFLEPLAEMDTAANLFDSLDLVQKLDTNPSDVEKTENRVVRSVVRIAADYEYTISNNEVTITKYIGSGVDITIPNIINGYSVTSIGNNAFSYCYNITSVVIPDSVTTIEDYSFFQCVSLKSVIIPKNVTRIGNCAFRLCKQLTSAVIPDSVTSIGERAFSACYILTSVVIPDSVTSIGEGAFEKCELFSSVEIPNSVTSIGFGAFAFCSMLTDISVSSDNLAYSSYDGVLFDKNKTLLLQYPAGKASEYQIPNTVTSIGKNAFYGCLSLTNVLIPEGVINIGEGAFGYCENLISAEIPKSVKAIADYAFQKCASLTSMVIPANVTRISTSMFESCTSLTNIVIPNNVIDISYRAFYYCTSLTNVVIPDRVTSIRQAAFLGCKSLSKVEIPQKVKYIENLAFAFCSMLTDISVSSDNLAYSSYDGVLFDKNKTLLLQYPAGKAGEYQIPNTVTSIGKNAFYGCLSLTSVLIPEGVTNIGEKAFYWCSSLTSIEIPHNVKSIGEAAFAHCSNIISIEIPNSVTVIGDQAFRHCYALTSAMIPDSVTHIGTYMFEDCVSLTNVVISEGVTSIGYGAFFFCLSLTSVVIPQSVTEIESVAFAQCQSLGSIYFSASPPVVSGTMVFSNTQVTVYYCSGFVGWSNKYCNRPTALWVSETLFDGNGGSSDILERTYNVGNPYGELPTASRPGHLFAGWWTAAEYGTLISEETLVPQLTTNHTLYAHWEIKQYSITFDSQGGTEVSAIIQDFDMDITPPIPPTKPLHTFSGWYPPLPGKMPAKDLEVRAIWIAEPYTENSAWFIFR